MAASDERERFEKLAWPPKDEGAFDVFDLEADRAVRPQRTESATAESRKDEDVTAASVAVRPPFNTAPSSRPAGGRAARGQRDEPPHVVAAADRPGRWKWWAVSSVLTRLRRPRRPAWLTTERAGIIALALVAVGEASFIGVGMIRSDNPPVRISAKPGGPALKPAPQAPTAGAVGTSGRLIVQTSPSGGGVLVDGRVVGTAPVSLDQVEAGDHTVVVQSRRGSLSQQVHIAAGRETQVLVPLDATVASPPPRTAPRPAAARGWLSVDAPVEIRIYEGDSLVGTSDMAQIALSAGRHSLVFANDEIGYRRTQAVVITAGSGSEVKLDLPKQTVAINALPWADVWIDGVHVGETPIGRATVTVGRHTVRLRNPDFGEKTVDTVVTVGEPARISVDMRK